MCSRAFHKQCLADYNRGTGLREEPLLDELGMDLEAWRKARETGRKCPNCSHKEYLFNCSVCLKEGRYEEGSTPKSRRSKSKSETTNDNRANNN